MPFLSPKKGYNIEYLSHDDKYCYPGTDVLINKFDIRDPIQFQKLELSIVPLRLIQLNKQPHPKPITSDYLCHIHWFLFQDLFEWAGKYRLNRLYLNNTTFAYPEYIVQEIEKLFDGLSKKNDFQDIKKQEFCHELAVFKTELNIIHPFRDGNGRCIRKLVEDIAFNAGYLLYFRKFNTNEYIQAMAKSVIDSSDLESLIRKNIS